jgi:hypothetical protein
MLSGMLVYGKPRVQESSLTTPSGPMLLFLLLRSTQYRVEFLNRDDPLNFPRTTKPACVFSATQDHRHKPIQPFHKHCVSFPHSTHISAIVMVGKLSSVRCEQLEDVRARIVTPPGEEGTLQTPLIEDDEFSPIPRWSKHARVLSLLASQYRRTL